MKTISELIEVALKGLNLDIARTYNPEPETDPWVIYSQVIKRPNLFTGNVEQSRTFYIDVDIYTTNPSLIDDTSKSIEEKLVEVGFKLKPSAGTIVEDDVKPVVYHEPLEFEYEKEM